MYLLWCLKDRFLKAESKIMPGHIPKRLHQYRFSPTNNKSSWLPHCNQVLGIFKKFPTPLDEKRSLVVLV